MLCNNHHILGEDEGIVQFNVREYSSVLSVLNVSCIENHMINVMQWIGWIWIQLFICFFVPTFDHKSIRY